MKFISTRDKSEEKYSAVSASAAILKGLAPDGGLYVPETFPLLQASFFRKERSYHETAVAVISSFLEDDELLNDLDDICREAFSFPVPLHYLDETRAVLELHHGPTAAFKDFGARFLASAMERISLHSGTRLTILVATSGDTGGAVASAFYGKANIGVKVLFPKGRVSARQEKQLTCWGSNIHAYAVRGAFDDCQNMVKRAFMDPEISQTYHLTSANSINLGRLLPQMVYYVHAAAGYLRKTGKRPTFVIPSGNVGNSVGAFWAKQIGAPIERIVLAVNANTTIPDFLASGTYEARESVATLANAMDVGDPSNMERLRYLFPDFDQLKQEVSAWSVSDDLIRTAIGEMWEKYHYAVCPHTAAGESLRHTILGEEHTIVIATAHPAKFETIVEPVIGEELEIPASLNDLLHRESSWDEIDPEMELLFS